MTCGDLKLRGLEVVLTAACNLKCVYCYQNAKQARSMSRETLRAALDLLLSSSSERVQLLFYGGEPLLELPAMRRAVDYVERRRRPEQAVSWAVNTNGTRLGDEVVRFLRAHRFSTQLSFDGVEPAQELRQPGTFARLDATLDRLRFRHPEFFRYNFSVAATVTGANLPWLADSVAYFLDKGVREISLGVLLTHDPTWRVDRLEEMDRQFARAYEVSLRHYRETGEVPLSRFRRVESAADDGPPKSRICGANGTDNLAVDVDGRLVGCVAFAGSHQEFPSGLLGSRAVSMGLGQIDDPDLERRLETFESRAGADALFESGGSKRSGYGECADCRYRRECTICPVSFGHIPGNHDPHRVPDLQCAFNLVSNKYRRRFPAQPDHLKLLLGGEQNPHTGKDSARPAAGG